MCNIGVPNNILDRRRRYRVVEIADSLCEKFPGLTSFAKITKDGSLEITFMYICEYNPPTYTHRTYTILPSDMVDMDLFEKDFRKKVVDEVIHCEDGLKIRLKESE